MNRTLRLTSPSNIERGPITSDRIVMCQADDQCGVGVTRQRGPYTANRRGCEVNREGRPILSRSTLNTAGVPQFKPCERPGLIIEMCVVFLVGRSY